MTICVILHFPDWLSATGRSPAFDVLEVEELASLLRSFYGSVRQKKSGEYYSKAAMVGLRSAIHRHVTSPPYSRQVNILQDREFQQANNLFKGVLKKLREEGKDVSKHHDPIEPEDVARLKDYFAAGLNNPNM